MGWPEDLERSGAYVSHLKATIGGALSLLTSVVFLATGRIGEGIAALLLGTVVSFFAFLGWRAERRSRIFEDES